MVKQELALRSLTDTYNVSGKDLKRRIVNSVTDGDAFRTVARNPQKYVFNNDPFRPNMLKARDDALRLKTQACNASDPWVAELIKVWVDMSGMTPNDADFWRERGFMDAVKAGRDLNFRRFLDDDGWAWIVVRDVPSHWLHKRRLPESVRREMVAAKERKKEQERKWW